MQIKLTDLDPTKEPVQLRRLVSRFQSCTGIPFEEITVNEEIALLVWLHTILVARNVVSSELADIILDEFKSQLAVITRDMQTDFETMTISSAQSVISKAAFLTVVDSTFALVTTSPEFLDLRTGNRVATLPQPPIEMVTYNLTTLFFLHANRIRRANNEANSATTQTGN